MKQTFIEWLAKKQKENRLEKEKAKKKYNSLSLSDKYAYQEMVKKEKCQFTLTILYLIPKTIIFIIIASLVFFFWWNINIIEHMREVTHELFMIFPILLILGLVFDIISSFSEKEYKRRLLLNEK